MKKIKTLLAAFILVAIGSLGYAQTAAEHHIALTNYHQKAKMHADALASGQSETKADQLKNVNEASKNLEEAKKSLSALKNHKHKKCAKCTIEHYTLIEKHHVECQTHLTALNSELMKPSPDGNKVKAHAKMLSESIDKAEKVHQDMQAKKK